MTVVELRAYKYITKEIELLEEEIERTRAKLESPAIQVMSHTPGAHQATDRIAELVAGLADMIAELKGHHSVMQARRREIISAISELDDKHQCVLRMKYIDGLTLEHIAAELNYNYRHIKRIHAEALKMLRS